MGQPLLQMQGLRREFPAGDTTVAVLRDIDLDIAAGEMVAIVGASGSGKSTLMNILGCLDRPTSGSYRIAGRETGELEPDALAALRREHFGFIFQRYHLLPDLTAQGNVELPSVYAGTAAADRHARSAALLERLGLADRMQHRPGQLSGGQQQRVSIARALMNGGAVILADEPTGALDKASGEQVMRILQELHAEGHTIILVTHDMAVAAHASRVIEISDGAIVADRRSAPQAAPSTAAPETSPRTARTASWRQFGDRFGEALRMALRAMNAHRLRTFLTMLGIIIGISAVVSVVALGASMTLPFLNLGEMRLNTAIARNQYEETVVNFRKSLYAALSETEKALSARTQLQAQEGAQQRALQEAREITRLYEARYRAGQVPLRAWLDAQERQRTAQLALSALHLDQLQNHLTLHKVLGGGLAAAG